MDTRRSSDGVGGRVPAGVAVAALLTGGVTTQLGQSYPPPSLRRPGSSPGRNAFTTAAANANATAATTLSPLLWHSKPKRRRDDHPDGIIAVMRAWVDGSARQVGGWSLPCRGVGVATETTL